MSSQKDHGKGKAYIEISSTVRNAKYATSVSLDASGRRKAELHKGLQARKR